MGETHALWHHGPAAALENGCHQLNSALAVCVAGIAAEHRREVRVSQTQDNWDTPSKLGEDPELWEGLG